jgi:formylmethanofuran dehydrogenase subunit E
MMIAQFVAIQEAITQKYDRTRSREDQPDQETTSSSNVTTTIRTKQEKNTSQECVICLEREANTMVLPCEHAVVCKACSDLLKNTPNQHLCVYCRQKIDHVLD